MMTPRPSKITGKRLAEYLCQGDYYSEGRKVDGVCFGSLCEDLDLILGNPIPPLHFQRLAEGIHPKTRAKLTERMNEDRRSGYDFTNSAPKSVSLMAFLARDGRIIGAHTRANCVMLREAEKYACYQVGQGLNKRYVRSGNFVGAAFLHGESRSLDPQLHTHPFVFPFTRTPDGRLLALETWEIFERRGYLTEVYRNALAAELRAIGYEIVKTEKGFELAGISDELLQRFSKRAQQRDELVKAREKELGRTLSNNEVATLVRVNRPRKLTEITPDEVLAYQLEQVSLDELTVLHRLRDSACRPLPPLRVSLALALDQAKEHAFERASVIPDFELQAQVLRANYGAFELEDVQSVVKHGNQDLLVADGRVTTGEVVAREQQLLAIINGGIGRADALGLPSAAGSLSMEQFKAVQRVLDCHDTVQVFAGKAGTGKTTTLAAMITGCSLVGREVACFAPSSPAVEVLRRDGTEQWRLGFGVAAQALSGAHTTQRLLCDERMREGLAGKVVVIDEYGLLSSKDFVRILELANEKDFRVLLVGDSSQHGAVDGSAAARLIERDSRVSVTELREVRRQASNPEYLRAAKAMANGDPGLGLRLLNVMGAVIEVADPDERRRLMAQEWLHARQATGAGGRQGSALMVAPTWAEIDLINEAARRELRAAGFLGTKESEFQSLWSKNWTSSERKDFRNYAAGQIIVARRRTATFRSGEELTVIKVDGERLVVRKADGKQVTVSPKQSGSCWTACDARMISIASGDEVRLRAIAKVRVRGGGTRRLSNGTVVKVAGMDAEGRLRLSDGTILLSREVVHSYATTSHAAQGMTVDSVFMTDPLSREGLYVSSTRGKSRIRVFTGDREALLDAARLRSEERMTGTQFVREAGLVPADLLQNRGTGTAHDLRNWLNAGIERGRDFALGCLKKLMPFGIGRRSLSLEMSPNAFIGITKHIPGRRGP